ncbi:MAG: cation:proton antiporter [Candidatus Omnitrophica bacterium]|nr:cation:proton antiporter [Candidatus Omnitrophota bacterium]MBU4487513.1 cation:proton antiporter [Candidatus Omnitrophota bacterium]MCG2704899.1 cation:proton antiporter [Candidatus Omnitrophota bacterium]
MSKMVRYIIGLIFLAAILFVVIFRPPYFLIYPDLQHLGFLKRALFILILCSILCLYRVVKGPTAPDRIVAIDMFGILIIGFCAVLTVSTGRSWYLDIGIAWALQSFISTLAFAKYFEGKDFDD